MKEQEIRFLGDLQRLQPQPGDVFVLTVDAELSTDQVEHLKKYWKAAMGDAKLLVLGRGMRIGCVAAPSGA